MRGRHPWVDKNNPRAWAICDRGGEIVHHHELLAEQHYVAGRLMPNGLLVCPRHIDIPNPQLGGHRPLRPDPVPVKNPRRPDNAAGPLPPPFPKSMPLHDTDGNVLFEGNGHVLMDLPVPYAFGIPDPLLDTILDPLRDDQTAIMFGGTLLNDKTPPLGDTHGAPLLDTSTQILFPE